MELNLCRVQRSFYSAKWLHTHTQTLNCVVVFSRTPQIAVQERMRWMKRKLHFIWSSCNLYVLVIYLFLRNSLFLYFSAIFYEFLCCSLLGFSFLFVCLWFIQCKQFLLAYIITTPNGLRTEHLPMRRLASFIILPTLKGAFAPNNKQLFVIVRLHCSIKRWINWRTEWLLWMVEWTIIANI